MMVAIGSFLPTLRGYVSGVPDFMAERALMQSVREFCEKGLCWTHDWEGTTTDAYSYDLELPEKTLANTIIGASLSGVPLLSGVNYELSGTSIALRQRPYSGQVLKVILSVLPSKAATDVDSNLFERWDEPIAKGAAASLGRQQNADWAMNLGVVDRLQQEFISGYQSARGYTLNNANRIYEQQTRHDFF